MSTTKQPVKADGSSKTASPKTTAVASPGKAGAKSSSRPSGTQSKASSSSKKSKTSSNASKSKSSGSGSNRANASKSNAAASAPNGTTAPAPNSWTVMAGKKLQDMIREIDPSYVLHPDVEEMLLCLADEFVDTVTDFACQLAKHRKSTVLEVRDLQMCLEKKFGIVVPGVSAGPGGASAADKVRPVLKSSRNPLHVRRLAVKRKFEHNLQRENKIPKTTDSTSS